MKRKHPPQMDEDERNAVVSKLEWEGGLEYLIMGSDFPLIRDKKFHSLRKAYVKAAQQMMDYIRLDDGTDEGPDEENSLCDSCGEPTFDCECAQLNKCKKQKP